MSICKFPGCSEKVYAKGFCCPHYGKDYLERKKNGFKKPIRKEKTIIDHGDYLEIIIYKLDGTEHLRTKIDKEDFHFIEKTNHICLSGTYKEYAYIWYNKKSQGLHRVIMGVKNQVDHINRDKLDNRKCNLREATSSQNKYNKIKHRDNTTGFKGVRRSYGRFIAKITVDKKTIHLGTFNSKIVAAVAYNRAAKKYHKEFACLNTFE